MKCVNVYIKKHWSKFLQICIRIYLYIDTHKICNVIGRYIFYCGEVLKGRRSNFCGNINFVTHIHFLRFVSPCIIVQFK